MTGSALAAVPIAAWGTYITLIALGTAEPVAEVAAENADTGVVMLAVGYFLRKLPELLETAIDVLKRMGRTLGKVESWLDQQTAGDKRDSGEQLMSKLKGGTTERELLEWFENHPEEESLPIALSKGGPVLLAAARDIVKRRKRDESGPRRAG